MFDAKRTYLSLLLKLKFTGLFTATFLAISSLELKSRQKNEHAFEGDSS